MIFTKDQSVHYNGQEHTIIEVNYLGLRLSSDETGETVFIRASEAESVLLPVANEVKIKPVEQKMLPRHWQQTYGNGMSMLGFKQRMRADSNKQEHRNSAGARTAERAAMGLHTNQHTIKPETPIETIREKSRSTSIRESSMDRKEKVST